MRRRRSYRRRSSRRYGRRLRHHKRGVLSKFTNFVKRPVGHIVAPTLGVAGVGTMLFSNGAMDHSLWNWIQEMAAGDPNNQAQYFSAYLENGLITALPEFVGAAAAGIIGSKLKV